MTKRILIAPLNWGLGHATRCIPIIKALVKFGFEPIIASDGQALELLKKEFPNLKAIELPSYNITYPQDPKYFRSHFLKKSFHFLKTIKQEKQLIKKLITSYNISGIISDNRFGCYSKQVPSVYITHQLTVLSGQSTWLSTQWHKYIIHKFDACWIPDTKDHTLSGKLSKCNPFKIPTTYIGNLSRFNKKDMNTKYDIMVLLSGPEPQRTQLEVSLLKILSESQKRILFVKGVIETKQQVVTKNHIRIYNFLTSEELEKAILTSELIISRSGYTTIMDLAKLQKRAFFIPTPGQFEQEYLAAYLEGKGIAPYVDQSDFSLEKLQLTKNYKGFSDFEFSELPEALFSLF